MRSQQLHSTADSKEESIEQQLPSQVISFHLFLAKPSFLQLLHALIELSQWHASPETQCHCLTVILQMMCSSQWTINQHIVKIGFQLSLSTYGTAKATSVHMAARATAAQILESYCATLYKEQVSDAAYTYKERQR